jgi:threonine dehydrogenase-like Zn-dependent dehydrogenase
VAVLVAPAALASLSHSTRTEQYRGIQCFILEVFGYDVGGVMATVAINGLGRIGRATLKVLAGVDDVRIAAINDVVPVDNLAYLLRYDSVYGRYGREVAVDDNALVLDGHRIPVYACASPAELPWRDLGVDLVFECTGVFREEPQLAAHLAAGARYVLLSALPAPRPSPRWCTELTGQAPASGLSPAPVAPPTASPR